MSNGESAGHHPPGDLPEIDRKALARIPRIALANTPTPFHELPRMTAALGGPRLFIKRDDLTGLATGGNKTRKLEFLLADALRQEADCLITGGGEQSNHCRQTAAAAARAGLACHLVLGGEPPQQPAGNLFLDELLGAELHWVPKGAREQRMTRLTRDLRSAGARPYLIPVGGSNHIGALGYVLAMFELADQMAAAALSFDHIILATSSGGTQAGMMLGAGMTGFTGKITAISIDQFPEDESNFAFRDFVRDLANRSAEHLGTAKRVAGDDILINCDYLGDGYGVVGDVEREAVQMLARTEGILVGPVYTGRAFGGMIDMVRQNVIRPGENVLFWHTGDETALHAYAREFV